MRFLLKPSSQAKVANASQILASTAKKATAATSPPTKTALHKNSDSSGKAWGQQCSPNCGCVLRIEADLSDCSSAVAASPTIVRASYVAKRVMATATTTSCNASSHELKPLTTQHGSQSSRPILTSCTCPTLHHLAQQTVEHLPGKTLAQLRNEIDMGMAGSRSSVAFRHTVLREKVLPMLEAKKNKMGIKSIHRLGKNANDTKENDVNDGAKEMDSTHSRGRCYDLVEDSLMSMIYERMPTPRKDDIAASYSPTLGGYFRMYSRSDRNQPVEDVNDVQQDEIVFDEVGDWQRQQSPSSYFLFGGDERNPHGKNAVASSGVASNDSFLSIPGMIFQLAMESAYDRIYANNNGSLSPADLEEEDASPAEYRPATTYLQLLDMYGNEHGSEKAEEAAMEDWLEFVDQMQYQENRSSSA